MHLFPLQAWSFRMLQSSPGHQFFIEIQNSNQSQGTRTRFSVSVLRGPAHDTHYESLKVV